MSNGPRTSTQDKQNLFETGGATFIIKKAKKMPRNKTATLNYN